jgi:hypothetical protein
MPNRKNKSNPFISLFLVERSDPLAMDIKCCAHPSLFSNKQTAAEHKGKRRGPRGPSEGCPRVEGPLNIQNTELSVSQYIMKLDRSEIHVGGRSLNAFAKDEPTTFDTVLSFHPV